jgi:hypothetical protein
MLVVRLHTRRLLARGLSAAALALCLAGCAALRYADYKLPAVRLDRPTNVPLPPSDDPAVQRALAAQDPAYPTPYHAYVDARAPGTFEGAHTVGLAFSGGGTRGIIYGAACVVELARLGDIIVDASNGPVRISLLDEVDYVSGVSTGAVPAALYALNYGPRCPETFRFNRWPDTLNIDLIAYTLKSLGMRPDWVARQFVLDMNSRTAMSSAFSAVYFEGKRFRIGSGLTFGDLPRKPVLLLASTVINDPGVPFIQTRLPYRYALDDPPGIPWGVGVQTFETFHADPMAYSLGEACYNSLSYPGSMRSGLMTVAPDRPWVFEGLSEDRRNRMARARTQPGYAGTYELKDGGLTDNRGVDVIAALFEKALPASDRPPLLIALDATKLGLSPPEQGTGLPKGWFGELMASMTTSWQTGQDAYQRLLDLQKEQGAFALVHLKFTDWLAFLPETGASKDPAATARLVELCRAVPSVGTPARLVELTRSIGTSYTALSDEQMDAVRVVARFAVERAKGSLLAWASRAHGGAPARFEHDPSTG